MKMQKHLHLHMVEDAPHLPPPSVRGLVGVNHPGFAAGEKGDFSAAAGAAAGFLGLQSVSAPSHNITGLFKVQGALIWPTFTYGGKKIINQPLESEAHHRSVDKQEPSPTQKKRIRVFFIRQQEV